MTLLLHPRACDSKRLRVWIGANNCTSAPAIDWRINDRPVVPAPVRAMDSVRPQNLVDASEARVFTGLYDFVDDGTGAPIQPAKFYDITASIEGGGRTERLRVRSLPGEIPRGPGETFNVMLVSCFWVGRDVTGIAGRVVSMLPNAYQPHLTILLGDQVYLDLPTLANFPDDEKKLAKKFEDAYLRNWTGHESGNPLLGGYASVLRAAPTVAIPDDHEFWNNYPHASPVIENSFTPEGRKRWGSAATAIYRAFQLPTSGEFPDLTTIDVDPLRIGCLDARTNRREDRSGTLTADALSGLQRWTAKVRDDSKFGMLATGQSLYDEPRDGLKGKVGDYTMASYGDYDAILDCALAMSGNGMPGMVVTGDVHWGRVIQTADASGVRLYEVICSPTSLVETIGVDSFNELKGDLKGLFGKKPDWPMHAKSGAVPPFLSNRKSLGNTLIDGNIGNQIAILSFERSAFGLKVTVTYFPLHRDASKNGAKVVRQPLNLQPSKVTHA